MAENRCVFPILRACVCVCAFDGEKLVNVRLFVSISSMKNVLDSFPVAHFSHFHVIHVKSHFLTTLLGNDEEEAEKRDKKAH